MKNQLTQTTGLNANNAARNQSQKSLVTGHSFSEFSVRRFSESCLQKMNILKERVTSALASEFSGLLNAETVRQAVNEADSLAAVTPFPALFLPSLAEEKVQVALAWQAKQRAIRNRPLSLAA